jgi:hypothetical protein
LASTRRLSGTIGALLLALALAGTAAAQSAPPMLDGAGDGPVFQDNSGLKLVAPVALPRMAPELALVTYEQRALKQAAELGATIDTVVIRAELPDTRKTGEYQLKRIFLAPKNLSFGAIKFVGDTFVKTNVILRLLQSEVDHVEKGEGGDLSISSRNYKFNYKRTEVRAGRTLHVFQAKPRQKRVGLFKGHVFVDAYNGSLVRVEGTMVKSPSFFIKKIEFEQEYADINGFTLPVHIRSTAKTRIIGRAVVDIFHTGYELHMTGDPALQAAPALAGDGTR